MHLYTTIGVKTYDLDANPDICIQIEEITDELHWRSVIITGEAYWLTDKQEIDQAIEFIKFQNPTFSPAINRTWIDSCGRAESPAFYQISQSEITGRTTSGISSKTLIA